MAESFIHKNRADKRKELQAYFGSLEQELEQAHRDRAYGNPTFEASWCKFNFQRSRKLSEKDKCQLAPALTNVAPQSPSGFSGLSTAPLPRGTKPTASISVTFWDHACVMRCLLFGLTLTVILCSHALALKPETNKAAYAADVCSLLDHHAESYFLPVNFLTRLIWKESVFDDQAVSPVGAEGIAQFMPGTAKLRGLKNSFDYREALAAAADYLAYLNDKFGNLGLAAAAYNLGEDGTNAWLENRRTLPAETEDYVLAVTGHSATEWRVPKTTLEIPGLGGAGNFMENCAKLVLRELLPPLSETERIPRRSWGVIIAGGFSESQTLAAFSRVKIRYAALLKDELPIIVRTRNLSRGRKLLTRVMIGRNSRNEAEALCASLRAQSGACVVSKN